MDAFSREGPLLPVVQARRIQVDSGRYRQVGKRRAFKKHAIVRFSQQVRPRGALRQPAKEERRVGQPCEGLGLTVK